VLIEQHTNGSFIAEMKMRIPGDFRVRQSPTFFDHLQREFRLLRFRNGSGAADALRGPAEFANRHRLKCESVPAFASSSSSSTVTVVPHQDKCDDLCRDSQWGIGKRLCLGTARTQYIRS